MNPAPLMVMVLPQLVGPELGLAAPELGPTAVTVAMPGGTTIFDGAEGRLVPTRLVAVTVNVLLSPLIRPDATLGLPDPVADCPPLPAVVVSVAVTA